jgi:hypothetical protein
MNTPEIKEGVAVRYPGTGPEIGHDRAHTNVIVTDPDQNGTVLLVSICSFNRFADHTCLIEADGSWEPITRRSYVAYHHTKGVSATNISNRIARQEITYLGAVPQEVYNRIKAGVTISKETPEMFKRAFLAQQPQSKPPGRVLRSNPSS